MKKSFKGFTLAEMMVVMLVLTILLAAAAPIMTKRKAGGASDQPWKYSINNTDAYFGLANNQTAMIGQDEKTDKDLNARLILTGNSDNPYITFKSAANNTVANMFFQDSNFIIGGPYDEDKTFTMSSLAQNTAFGYNVLKSNTDGTNNVAVGYNALFSNTTGRNNVALGSGSLIQNGEGNNNTAIGTDALSINTAGNSNTAVGYGALKQNTAGNSNTAVGFAALSGSIDGISTNNTAIGYQALSGNSGGNDNTAVGYNSLQMNTTGYHNIAIGNNSLLKNQTGGVNIAIGYEAAKYNTDGNYNIAVGQNALANNTTGENNTTIGNFSLGMTTGSNNTAIGYAACNYARGSNKTCIGANSGPKDTDKLAQTGNTTKVVWIGDETTTVAIRGNLIVNGITLSGEIATDDCHSGNCNSMFRYLRTVDGDAGLVSANQLYGLANSSDGWLYDPTKHSGKLFTSDKRLKNIKGENKAGLEEVRKLNVFDFTFKKDDKKTPRVGVIAQDLRKIFPNAVVEGEDGYLQIRHEDMFYAVINAIKQLDKVIEALIAEVKVDLAKILKHDEDIAKLQKQNNEIVKQNKELQNKNEELEKRIDKLEKRLEKVLKELDED